MIEIKVGLSLKDKKLQLPKKNPLNNKKNHKSIKRKLMQVFFSLFCFYSKTILFITSRQLFVIICHSRQGVCLKDFLKSIFKK